MRMQFGSNNENFSEVVTSIAPFSGQFDNAPNDSDKSFTVPGGEEWEICYANVLLTTTATVGNRQLRMTVTDADGNTVGYMSAGAVQAASLTRSYGFMKGIYRETAFIDGMIQVPIPFGLRLKAGSTIRFHDNGPAGTPIDPTADDMTVSLGYCVYKGVK